MKIDAKTRLVLLLGYPVEHSRSPLIHNTAFQAQGVNGVYVAASVPPAALPAAVAGLPALGCFGANVTIPHKHAVLPLMDALSPHAEAVGAVNTIVCRKDEAGAPLLYGDNTDVPGFLEPLADHAPALGGASMLVFGAGGAARAVVYALLTAFRPERLTLVARRIEAAERLARDLSAYDSRNALRVVSQDEARDAVRSSALLVNATPLGMHPETEGTPWPDRGNFGPSQLVYDLVYNPRRTRLMDDAAERGATVLGGLGMLVSQAAASYVQWTGKPMPVDQVHALLVEENP
jgi:shikimate dehydrogenase